MVINGRILFNLCRTVDFGLSKLGSLTLSGCVVNHISSSFLICLFQGPKTYFLDTLSLHMCIAGFTSLQRNLWESANAGRIGKVPWMLGGSGNKLQDLQSLYCGKDDLDKSMVKIFVEGTLDDVREHFQV